MLPQITGITGSSIAMEPKRLKNLSSAPNTKDGRRTVAPGMAASTACSPSALVRA